MASLHESYQESLRKEFLHNSDHWIARRSPERVAKTLDHHAEMRFLQAEMKLAGLDTSKLDAFAAQVDRLVAEETAQRIAKPTRAV